jgi:hypothetical protein
MVSRNKWEQQMESTLVREPEQPDRQGVHFVVNYPASIFLCPFVQLSTGRNEIECESIHPGVVDELPSVSPIAFDEHQVSHPEIYLQKIIVLRGCVDGLHETFEPHTPLDEFIRQCCGVLALLAEPTDSGPDVKFQTENTSIKMGIVLPSQKGPDTP